MERISHSDIARMPRDMQVQVAAKIAVETVKKQERERKLHNEPCDYVEADGSVRHFDSIRECRRYQELLLLQKAGKIEGLMCQVGFLLIPRQVRKDGKIERRCEYVADFTYRDAATGEEIVEDVKGYRDPKSAAYAKFVIKRKLMLYVHGITVKEV